MFTQVVDEAKYILAQHRVDEAKKKLRVHHYVALLRDFGVPEAEFSEVRGGKTVRIKAKQLSAFFWSRDDVCARYHTHECGNS